MPKIRNTPRLGPPKLPRRRENASRKPAAPKPRARKGKAARFEDVVFIGGGYYELPDGRRVRGKKAVAEALGLAH